MALKAATVECKCIIMDQKNVLGQQTSALVANCCFSFDFIISYVYMPSEHKKWITPRCATVMKFESAAKICKQTLIKPGTNSS